MTTDGFRPWQLKERSGPTGLDMQGCFAAEHGKSDPQRGPTPGTERAMIIQDD
jgi:hypothetical protein